MYCQVHLQSGNAINTSDQIMYYGHLKYFVRLISQQTDYSTTNRRSCSNRSSFNITVIFQADFQISFDDVFITQCVVVLTWL